MKYSKPEKGGCQDIGQKVQSFKKEKEKQICFENIRILHETVLIKKYIFKILIKVSRKFKMKNLCI